MTDGVVVPLALAIDGANRPDFQRAKGTLDGLMIARPEPAADAPQHLCLDKGHDYCEVYGVLLEFGYTPHVGARGEEAAALIREPAHRGLGQAVGGGADPHLAEPIPADPGSVGEDLAERSGLPPTGLRDYHPPASRAIGTSP